MEELEIKNSIKVSKLLSQFLENEVLKKLDLNVDKFWEDFDHVINVFAPKNENLLKKREDIKKKIDAYYISNKDKPYNHYDYINFLKEIEYIVPEGPDFTISTENVDVEIANIPGPQLVVPVTNARYSINAANARWGSLYDALYGTDLVSEEDGCEKGKGYNPTRGRKVILFAKEFLDKHFPLLNGLHDDVTNYTFNKNELVIELSNGSITNLKESEKYIGFNQINNDRYEILLKNNNLHVILSFDKNSQIGSNDKSNLQDVILESAITTIQDCEDSVATVDAEDKVLAYKNWLGLMKGDLEDTFVKNGKKIIRKLNKAKVFKTKNGELNLSGLSLMLIRNVGHLMTNPAIIYSENKEVPEGIMDTIITTMISMFDLKNGKNNSKTGSVYIVKPKMHGPEEVAFTIELIAAVEKMLGLPNNTIKIGIIDEERRTTVNLKECIRHAKERLVFINTGFLDRTGDEIHTAMEGGPIIPKAEIKGAEWINAYEKNNVLVGLKCGLSGKAQIGKGMWAMPDLMKEMYEQKIQHPKSGANTAWVPSPTAATIHALHYHEVDVFEEQKKISNQSNNSDLQTKILTPPIAFGFNWSPQDIEREIDNNSQGILGYVVRWVDQGVGCSKVPDINDVGLMEDRATCRISSQHLANWLHHNIINKDQAIASLKKMAKIVDKQNENDGDYKKMSDNYDGSLAFQAAVDLVFKGTTSPSGYTEPVLHERRLELKSLSR